MRIRLGFALYTTVVVVFGVLTLAGLLVGDGSAFGDTGALVAPLNTISNLFIRLVVVVIALTLVIGIFNLLSVHAVRLVRGPGTGARLNSLILLVSFIVALVAYQFSSDYNLILENVQVQIELALAALICFALVYGAFRLLRRGVTWGGLVFLAGMLIILIGALPLSQLEPLQQVTDWLTRVPLSAGARGILLGIALATLVTGVRVIIGQDRTYGNQSSVE
ncbi:MAG: hypothetical protein H6670_12320 [Anaerolineaceae bacterium]|nr:hypothetical protein [Anaerolineaceae bacterium]